MLMTIVSTGYPFFGLWPVYMERDFPRALIFFLAMLCLSTVTTFAHFLRLVEAGPAVICS
jgi:hypothetical protein